MRKQISLWMVIFLILFLAGTSGAQFFPPIGPPNPFLLSMIYPGAFSRFPSLPPLSPFIFPGLVPRQSLPMLSPIQPVLRQARATVTVTIFFNPTLSVIQLTVLPLNSPIAPLPVATPVVPAPVISPTALVLLPLLSGLTGPTQTKTLTRLSTTAPALPALTGLAGLTALLPLI